VHKHRNLLAHAPERLHEEVTADYTDMIYAATPAQIESRRKAFIRKWRLKCRAVADSLEEAGDRLFTFTRLPPSQWRSARTTNAIERLHEEFKRRIKMQTVLPSAETAAMLFWALLASGQISMRKELTVGGRLPKHPSVRQLTSRPDSVLSKCRRSRHPIPTQIATAPDAATRILSRDVLARQGEACRCLVRRVGAARDTVGKVETRGAVRPVWFKNSNRW
jgi:hypothetical protein